MKGVYFAQCRIDGYSLGTLLLNHLLEAGVHELHHNVEDAVLALHSEVIVLHLDKVRVVQKRYYTQLPVLIPGVLHYLFHSQNLVCVAIQYLNDNIRTRYTLPNVPNPNNSFLL